MAWLDRFNTRSTTPTAASIDWLSYKMPLGEFETHAQRIAWYRRARNIYWGKFASVFDDAAFEEIGTAGTYANLAARAANARVSAILSGVPRAVSTDGAMQSLAAGIMEYPRNLDEIRKAVLDRELLGDGILVQGIRDSRPVLKAVPPEQYFPVKFDASGNPIVIQLIKQLDADELMVREYVRQDEPQESGHRWTLQRYRASAKTGERFTESEGALEDLGTDTCPVVHLPGPALSGQRFGKAPLRDCERDVEAYAATKYRLNVIIKLATDAGLLTVPEGAVDEETGTRLWTSEDAYIVSELMMINGWDKSKFGWIESPGSELLKPALEGLARQERDVYAAFGLTPGSYGDPQGQRDTSRPGIQELNASAHWSIRASQDALALALDQLCNAAADMVRVWVDEDFAPEPGPSVVTFVWPPSIPVDEDTQLDRLLKKLELGVPRAQLHLEMGYSIEQVNRFGDQWVAEQQAAEFGWPVFEGDDTLDLGEIDLHDENDHGGE